MLNRNIYEVLPYLYLGLGTVCVLLVKSTVIVIAALLLVSAGLIVLIMRYQFRHLLAQPELAMEQGQLFVAPGHSSSRRSRPYLSRTASERRRRGDRPFPLQNAAGGMVAFERRTGQRRSSLS